MVTSYHSVPYRNKLFLSYKLKRHRHWRHSGGCCLAEASSRRLRGLQFRSNFSKLLLRLVILCSHFLVSNKVSFAYHFSFICSNIVPAFPYGTFWRSCQVQNLGDHLSFLVFCDHVVTNTFLSLLWPRHCVGIHSTCKAWSLCWGLCTVQLS